MAGTTLGTIMYNITEKENNRVLAKMKKDWHLGPDKTSIMPDDNNLFWLSISNVWDVPEEDARRRLCANCEYFDNRPEALKDMESVPINKFDKDGGGRGYCVKFDFICHNLRVCQAWEPKEFINEED